MGSRQNSIMKISISSVPPQLIICCGKFGATLPRPCKVVGWEAEEMSGRSNDGLGWMASCPGCRVPRLWLIDIFSLIGDLSSGSDSATTTSSNSCDSSATRPTATADRRVEEAEEFHRGVGWDCAASTSGSTGGCESPPSTGRSANDKPPKAIGAGRFENLLRKITPNPAGLPALGSLHSSADHLLLTTKRSNDSNNGGETKGDDYRKFLRPQPASRSKSSSVYGSLR